MTETRGGSFGLTPSSAAFSSTEVEKLPGAKVLIRNCFGHGVEQKRKKEKEGKQERLNKKKDPVKEMNNHKFE